MENLHQKGRVRVHVCVRTRSQTCIGIPGRLSLRRSSNGSPGRTARTVCSPCEERMQGAHLHLHLHLQRLSREPQTFLCTSQVRLPFRECKGDKAQGNPSKTLVSSVLCLMALSPVRTRWWHRREAVGRQVSDC